MFAITDLEYGLMLRHKREMSNLADDAQRIVDRQDREIVRLRRALSAALADNEALRREKGLRAIADLEAFRAARRRAAH